MAPPGPVPMTTTSVVSVNAMSLLRPPLRRVPVAGGRRVRARPPPAPVRRTAGAFVGATAWPPPPPPLRRVPVAGGRRVRAREPPAVGEAREPPEPVGVRMREPERPQPGVTVPYGVGRVQ